MVNYFTNLTFSKSGESKKAVENSSCLEKLKKSALKLFSWLKLFITSFFVRLRNIKGKEESCLGYLPREGWNLMKVKIRIEKKHIRTNLRGFAMSLSIFLCVNFHKVEISDRLVLVEFPCYFGEDSEPTSTRVRRKKKKNKRNKLNT